MKANPLCLVFLIFSMRMLNAQDFKLIPHNQDRLYFQMDIRIFAAEIASVDSSESDELILMEGLTELYRTTDCYNNTAPDFLGKSVRIAASGEHLIQMDASGDLIANIRTQSLVDETWTCFEFNGEIITASCISNAPGFVNGIPELIKTIRFSNDFCDLRISQTQGIISTPSWNQLYENINQLESITVLCVERIWDETLINKFQTPFGDLAADLQEGDVLHIEEVNISPPNQTSRKLIKAQFLNKTLDTIANSYELTFKQEVDEWKNQGGQISQSIYLDTVTTYIGRHLWLDTTKFDYPVPVNRIFGTGEIINYFKFNDRLRITVTGLSYENSDTWFPFVFDLYGLSEYIEGLGGPYYKNNMFASIERNLVYYKKGSEEWGTPFTFTVSTNEVGTFQPVLISPNPVQSGELIYLGDGLLWESVIHLIDLHGRVIQTGYITSGNFRINPNVMPGMYIILGYSNENKLFRSKLLIR